jgi:hypothetical protein
MNRRAFVSRAVGTAAGVTAASPVLAAKPPPQPTTSVPLDDLHHAVGGVLKHGGIGVPVFVRYTLQLPGREKDLLTPLLPVAAAVIGWIEAKTTRVFAVGNRAEAVSVTFEFASGATALNSIAAHERATGNADIFVVGNHGVIYHDAGLDALLPSKPSVPDGPADANMRRALERSLHSGKPESTEAP